MDNLKLYAKDEKQLDPLVNTVQIFSLDIGMEFGIDKCGILVMKRGRYKNSEGIKLPNDQEIKGINLDNGYKYLGILEADGIKEEEMKEKIRKEYTRRRYEKNIQGEDTKRIYKTCTTGSHVKIQWGEYLLSYKFKSSCSSQV